MDERNESGMGALVAAGLILAALALGFALAPRIVGWANAVSPTLGVFVAVAHAVVLIGGFFAVFWLRSRSRR